MRPLRIDFKPPFLAILLLTLIGIFLSSLDPGPRSALAEAASDPPPLAASFVSTGPKMVFVDPPGIYYAPGSPYPLYRIDRTWYYYYDEKWYQSDRHDGPWRYLSPARVPDPLKNLPERYIKKESGPLQADAESPKRKKGRSVRSKKKRKSSPKKISSPRPLSS
ncbi:MAG TPA: hypothetical protein VFA47_12845 [Candidatus Manganitrophaceae bacterium]|nr:hypothetical protein [Candidatus Manganitrophaceae bacterium]